MASVYWDSQRKSWRLAVVINGRRKTLWLGRISESGANTVRAHIELLLASQRAGVDPPPDTQRWTLAVDKAIAKKLREWGLIKHAGRPDLPSTLRAWIDHYIDSRDDVGESTRVRYRIARDHICRRLGDDIQLADISEADADRMAANIRMQQAGSTAGKTLKLAKMFLHAAVKNRIIAESPFAHLVAGGQSGKDRDYYVEPATADLIIQHAKDPLWQFIYAVTRYAGFRCPSEILCLEWSHINWETGIIAMHSPKTGLRQVPIFEKIRPYLEAVPETAGNPYVCARYRSTDSSGFTRHLEATCRSAGIECWPKPWVNMRASCRTDLELLYPVATCNAWMGHSTKVARQHYARVSNADWQRAIGKPYIQPQPIKLRRDA